MNPQPGVYLRSPPNSQAVGYFLHTYRWAMQHTADQLNGSNITHRANVVWAVMTPLLCN